MPCIREIGALKANASGGQRVKGRWLLHALCSTRQKWLLVSTHALFYLNFQDGTDKPDLSYFAPDCFHLSAKGHRAAADALWNNMVSLSVAFGI